MHAARTMTKGATADPLALFLRLCNPDPDVASAAGELTPFAVPPLPFPSSSSSSSSSSSLHLPAWIRPVARRTGADHVSARRRAAPLPQAIDPPLAAEWDAFVTGTTPSSSSKSPPALLARDAALAQWTHFQASFDNLSDPAIPVRTSGGADNLAPLQFAPPGTSLDDAYGAVLNTVTRSASGMDAAWHKSPPVDCADVSWRRNKRARVAPERAAEMARAGKLRLAMLARHLGAGRSSTETTSEMEIKQHKGTKVDAAIAPVSRTDAATAYDACMAHQSVQLSPSF
ncbi:hypothetical protein AMAG_09820 [Allomyces macrogynus ATCC 38327]|uniref:Uncharacterized protein n=1 Tax=Allomyces macrogynus (strain ATCC 38327) TaxID=578462 RepID=A0A0L0STK4_ALLM3|nr:hypothetical protein AMAG_09820 [Allomyces macrogynus ATCC 38327]|eukprot:KNE65852.1 hypothetical protein AMAG_09820 [Allomyces macrogynus ATCC 38327]